jgi:hypothetical protein
MGSGSSVRSRAPHIRRLSELRLNIQADASAIVAQLPGAFKLQAPRWNGSCIAADVQRHRTSPRPWRERVRGAKADDPGDALRRKATRWVALAARNNDDVMSDTLHAFRVFCFGPHDKPPQARAAAIVRQGNGA